MLYRRAVAECRRGVTHPDEQNQIDGAMRMGAPATL